MRKNVIYHEKRVRKPNMVDMNRIKRENKKKNEKK